MLSQTFGETASGSYTPPITASGSYTPPPAVAPKPAPKLEGASLWLTAGVLLGAAVWVALSMERETAPSVETYTARGGR